MHGNTWWHMGGMWFFWLIALAIVIVVIYLVVRSIMKAQTPREAPAEILQQRFARGEIEREEYERAMQALHDSGPGGSG